MKYLAGTGNSYESTKKYKNKLGCVTCVFLFHHLYSELKSFLKAENFHPEKKVHTNKKYFLYKLIYLATKSSAFF